MAGDWIKAEKALPNKPEVMRLARLWGITQDAVVGALFRFWSWADDATVDGHVDGVASHEIDDMMRFPGFAQGLVSVRWLKIDDRKMRIAIPNFDRHLSESSKKRVLKNRRQAKWRANSVDARVDGAASTNASTREEKSIKTIRAGERPVDNLSQRSTAGDIDRPLKPKSNGAWRHDPVAAAGQAAALGISTRPGETLAQLVARIDAHRGA